MHPNLAKQRLKEGRLALGLGLRQARTVDIASAAATCGFDVLFIGTSDLCAEIGILGQVGDARVEAAYRRVIDACRRHGKHPGMGGVYDPPHMEKYVRMGMRFILGGSDLSLLMAAAKERAGFLRKAAGEA